MAQRIGHQPPKLVVQVQFLPGAKKANMNKKIVSVVGGHNCTREVEQLAHNLGKMLAKVVDVLVSGGLSGTM